MNPLKKFQELAQPFDVQQFAAPPTVLWPTYTWNWNGALNRETIRRQIDEMAEAGIKSFYFLPESYDFLPNRMTTFLRPDYMSPKFLEYVRFTMDYAKSKGMAMWLYDECGFPSGMAGGQVVKKDPSTMAKRVQPVEVTLEAGQTWTPDETVIAGFRADATRLTAGFAPAQAETITEYRLTPIYATYSHEPNTPRDADTSEPRTGELFIALTHKVYKEALGDRVGGYAPLMFTDEPAISQSAWPSELVSLFKKRYGYDICNHLPALFSNDDEPAAQQVRIDYGLLVGELFRKNYFQPIQDWCHENSIYASGHLDVDNSPMGSKRKGYGNMLQTLRLFDIPGVDVIWRQIFRHEDGAPMKGGYGPDLKDNVFFPRLAASAANQTGGNLTLSEVLAVYGNGTTMDDIRFACNYQYIRGINMMNLMDISYERQNSGVFCLPHPLFHREFPGYLNLKLLNTYLARMTYLTTIGTRCADTALVMPVHDVHANGQREQIAIDAFETAGCALERQGVDFDIIDYQGILDAEIKNGKLCIGKAEYSCVVLPEGVWVPEDVRKKVQQVCGKPVPVLQSEEGFAALRTMKRQLPNGDTLYFVLNESAGAVCSHVVIPDQRNVCTLRCIDGAVVYAAAELTTDGTRLPIELPSGEIAVFLFGAGAEYAQPNHRAESRTKHYALTQFTAGKTEQFILNERGTARRELCGKQLPVELGQWPCDVSFSGSMCYRTDLRLDCQPVGTAMLDLGKVCYSACVYVNGREAGICGMEPNRVYFDATLLNKGTNRIEIVVSNTAGNAFVAFPAREYWEERYLSGYYDRERKFEQNTLESGLFGPVTLQLS